MSCKFQFFFFKVFECRDFFSFLVKFQLFEVSNSTKKCFVYEYGTAPFPKKKDMNKEGWNLHIMTIFKWNMFIFCFLETTNDLHPYFTSVSATTTLQVEESIIPKTSATILPPTTSAPETTKVTQTRISTSFTELPQSTVEDKFSTETTILATTTSSASTKLDTTNQETTVLTTNPATTQSDELSDQGNLFFGTAFFGPSQLRLQPKQPHIFHEKFYFPICQKKITK